MTTLGVVLLMVSLSMAGVQLVIGLKLIAALRRPPSPLLTDAQCPPVLALLCLRGTDPFLPESLRRLLTQDYPNYTVRIVIDTADDPACELVADVIRQTGTGIAEVVVLDRRDRHCSAKMSSLLFGTESLPEDTEYVATFDGDALLHPSCLRELVTPLVRQEASVTTGNRWFAPPQMSLGAFGRFQWNLGCVPLMYAMGLPWGGCLAMSKEIISDPELRALYAQAFAEDMLLGSYLRERNKPVCFVPRATIVNRENITLSGLLNFLTRQMLCVRLHHFQWKRIFGVGGLLTALMGIILPMGLLFPTLRPWSAVGLSTLLGVSFVTMVLAGREVRRIISVRGECLISFTPRNILAILLALPVTQFVTLAANVRALAGRQISWRGLTYRIGRHPIVTLVREVSVRELGHEYNSVEQEDRVKSQLVAT